MPTSNRYFSGFAIEGEHQGVEVAATLWGKINVGITGRLSKEDRGVQFGSKAFDPAEIVVTDKKLTCLALHRFESFPSWKALEFFRDGFAVALEAGMADTLREALTRVVPLAAQMRQVAQRMEALLAVREKRVDGFNYVHDAVEQTLAHVVLDGTDLQHAADAAFARYVQKDDGLSAEVGYFKVQFLVAAQQQLEGRHQ
jgi:hypothetical protein